MSLEQAIHTRWVNDAGLTALVPAGKFVTGRLLGGASPPYATLERAGTRNTIRTTSRRVEEILVRFHVWAAGLDEAKQVAAAIQARFAGQAFTAAGVTVLRMRQVNETEVPANDGAWRLSLEYVAVVEM